MWPADRMTDLPATSLPIALERFCKETLGAWRESPNQVVKDYNEEQNLLSGGYAERQILELVQNATDASIGRSEAKIELRIAQQYLYAANTGTALDEAGLRALIFGSLSPKRGEETGRFGLGFRSLLRLGGTVDFFSAGIAFRFDPPWCAAMARNAARLDPDAGAPGMRLVKLLDLETECRIDPVLSSLGWADTVVRAQLASPDALKSMQHELKQFPAEFLLFPDADIELGLLDEADGGRRIRRLKDDGIRTIIEADRHVPWHVFARHFDVNDASARQDAGALHARGTVRISWAIPATGRDAQAGRFWSAFPTQTPSVIPGVLDAPWKVNSDRSALTGQAWNAALMDCAAKLVAENLPLLVTSDDPGRPISALPRQLERKDEPAAPLHEAVWREVHKVPFVANASGILKLPAFLLRPPVDNAEFHEAWSALAPATLTTHLIHHACIATGARASRLEQLARRLTDAPEDPDDNHDEPVGLDDLDGNPALRRLDLKDWFESIATTDPEIGKSVVMLAGKVAESLPHNLSMIRSLAIIPTQDGKRAAASSALFSGIDDATASLPFVHAALAADEAVRDVLTRVLRVQAMNDGSWLRALEVEWQRTTRPNYEKGWALLRDAPPAIASKFMAENRSDLRVKTRHGDWAYCDDVVLPGRIVSEDETAGNEGLLADANFARENTSLLTAIELSDVPRDGLAKDSAYRGLYHAMNWAIVEYKKRAPGAYSARSGSLGYSGNPRGVLAGAAMLEHLRGNARARLTSLLLERLSRIPAGRLRVGGVGSPPTVARYEPIAAPDPTAWLLWKFGAALIGNQRVDLAACSEVRASLSEDGRGTVIEMLPDDSPIRDRWVAGWPTLPLPVEPVWAALLKNSQTRDHATLLPLWLAAASRRFVPEHIPDPYSAGEIHLTDVFVASTADDLALAADARLPAVLLDGVTAALWLKHGARDIRNESHVRHFGELSDPVRIDDYIPGLAEYYVVESGPTITFVDRIERSLGPVTSAAPFTFEGGRLLVSREWLGRTQKREIFQRLVEALAGTYEFSKPVAEILAVIDLTEVERLRAEITACPDLPSRLLRAACSREALVESLPEAARRPLRLDTADREVANLCLDINGSGALRLLQKALDHQGLRPPPLHRWGSDEARQFVLELGFPLSFAGSANPRPPAELSVGGPHPLPPLHDYQKSALAELQGLISSRSDRRRAVLSLPTGAGKTRVAVEAAIRSILCGGQLGRPLVLWVAQTEELAEQAVEAFRHVWAVEGLQEANLRIVRFWGGQRTPPETHDAQPTVVVALVQTLDLRMGHEDAAWLARAGMVVIDESHHAIAPTYTTLLNQVGVATGQKQASQGKTDRPEPALLGLSATPFRSSGEDDSRRLAARFDAKVIPSQQADLYLKLRGDGILSNVEVSRLDFMQRFELSENEKAALKQYGELPESALKRLAGIEERNDVIISAVEAAAERSILLFSNGVDHAVELAARLSLKGIRARAVSGETDRSMRRDAVSAFKRGEVRVICNAVVFATGFDAPGVEMVLIARPVFSPVRFMQMVGRGLRGPKNGGTACCRILTVRDNIDGYADRDPLDWWRQYYE